jgi:hypothetical protein
LTPFKTSLSSFSSLEISPPPSRGSHPTPHPAKFARKGNGEKTEHVRHHSSPNFSSDFGEASNSENTRQLTGDTEKENVVNKNGEVVKIQNVEAEVEQFTVVLKALAERVQKVRKKIQPHVQIIFVTHWHK